MLDLFNTTLLLGGVLLFSLYLYFKSAYSYWKKRGVPTVKPTPPFGNLAGAFLPGNNPPIIFNKLYYKFKDEKIAGVYSFLKPILLLRDPEVIKEVMVKDFDHFYNRGTKANIKADPLEGHLFMLSGPMWRNLRIKLTPTFTSGKMKMMFQTVAEIGKELTAFLEAPAGKSEVVEVKDVLARYTTDVIASCAFGIQCNCLKDPNAEFRTWGRRLFAPSFKTTCLRIISFLFPFLIKYLRTSLVPKDISHFFRYMVRDTIEYREKNDIHRNDFMQLMILVKNKTLGAVEEDDLIKMPDGAISGLHANAPFEVTMDVIAAQAFGFFLAGFETSATTMTFCLHEMAVNTDIQDRLREEIDAMLEKSNGQLEYDAIMQLEYLDKVISETLRKYPPVTWLSRECTSTTLLGGTDVTVEKGTIMMLPVYALHHDPKYFPDPERFDPERFNEEEKKKRPHYCYLPFGEGPRICIGMRFGLMQTKIGLISVLSKYKVHVSEKTVLPLKFDPKSLVLAPKGGMWLKVTKRRDK